MVHNLKNIKEPNTNNKFSFPSYSPKKLLITFYAILEIVYKFKHTHTHVPYFSHLMHLAYSSAAVMN